jgi:hypothetical protein
MMGPGMIRAVNAAATVQALLDKDEDLIYKLDEIATDSAIEAGWHQGEDGEWVDNYGDESDHPLDCLFHYNLPDSLQDEIVNEFVRTVNEEGT